MKAVQTFVFVALALLAGCGKEDSLNPSIQEGSSLSESGTSVVEAANGKHYAVSCLQKNGVAIQQGDQDKLESCEIDRASGKGRGMHRNGSYYYVFYPPTYYCPTNTYTTTYTPTYYSNSNANSFCSYIFGGTTNYNCYGLFGYGSSYTRNYDNRCDYCLNSYYPSQCRNRCWSGSVWTY